MTRYEAIKSMSLPQLATFLEQTEDYGSTWTADFAEVYCNHCDVPEGSCCTCQYGSVVQWWLSQDYDGDQVSTTGADIMRGQLLAHLETMPADRLGVLYHFAMNLR